MRLFSVLICIAWCMSDGALAQQSSAQLGDIEQNSSGKPCSTYSEARAELVEKWKRSPGTKELGDLQAQCEMVFDVKPSGKVDNIDGSCIADENSDLTVDYLKASIRAMGRVTFAPKIINGEKQWRCDVVYPIEFSLE